MAARSGMATLVQRVRDLASCGTADYSTGGTTYWTDDQIQAMLDENRAEVFDENLVVIPQVDSGGTTTYTEYRSVNEYFESTDAGTAVFYLRDGTGARAGTALWTADYLGGRITFSSDTSGTTYYLTGRSYDVFAAAADVWDQKASHVSDRYDFTADGATFRVSQMVAHYLNRARHLRAMSPTGGISVSTMVRNDIVA